MASTIVMTWSAMFLNGLAVYGGENMVNLIRNIATPWTIRIPIRRTTLGLLGESFGAVHIEIPPTTFAVAREIETCQRIEGSDIIVTVSELSLT